MACTRMATLQVRRVPGGRRLRRPQQVLRVRCAARASQLAPAAVPLACALLDTSDVGRQRLLPAALDRRNGNESRPGTPVRPAGWSPDVYTCADLGPACTTTLDCGPGSFCDKTAKRCKRWSALA